MENIRGNIKSFRMLMVVWILAVSFSAVMFTIALIYDIMVALIISGVTGMLSLIGIVYTAGLIIKLENHLKYLEYRTNN